MFSDVTKTWEAAKSVHRISSKVCAKLKFKNISNFFGFTLTRDQAETNTYDS